MANFCRILAKMQPAGAKKRGILLGVVPMRSIITQTILRIAIFDGPPASHCSMVMEVSEESTSFQNKSRETLAAELVGFPEKTLELVIQFKEEPSAANLREMLPPFITFHLPAGVGTLSGPLGDDLLLVQDFGLDSLALSEMAFKMEEVFGFRVETQEVFGIESYGQLVKFLSSKLDLS